MKMKKVFAIAGISLAALLLLAAGGLFIWSSTGTYPAGSTAETALASDDRVEVVQDHFIRFLPRDGYTRGLIFYPGGLVEPGAYAPVLHNIAAGGILVVLTPMPLNLGILNTTAADAVYDEYPQIQAWVLGGHSLGGASAGMYASGNSEKLAGLVFLDSYPPESADLSGLDIPALSIFGINDNVPNIPHFEDMKAYMPVKTIYVPIEGASHAQFGDYGPQKGDVEPRISLNRQHEIVTEKMLTFISKL